MTTTRTTATADALALLDRPLDAIFEHGPGVTTRQYNAVHRYLSGPKGTWTPTMADLLGMDVEAKLAEGPCPFPEGGETLLRTFAIWQVYRRRDGLVEIRGVSEKSAHEIRTATLAWWYEARAESSR